MTRPTIRRGVLLVAVILLAAAAGCSALSDGATPTANTTTTTPTDASTATPTNSSTSSSSDAGPNVTGADLDGAALSNATTAAVEDAGSYTLESVSFRSGARQQRTSRAIIRANFTTDRGMRTTSLSRRSRRATREMTSVVHTDGAVSYRKLNTSSGVFYNTSTGPYERSGDVRPVDVDSFYHDISFVTDGAVWTENGTSTVEGVNTTRYTLVGLTDTNATVVQSSGTLLIDDDDVVRRASLSSTVRVNGQLRTSGYQFRITGIGSTTVADPPWLADAPPASESS